MAVRFIATDPDGIAVTCHDDTWIEHIASRHVELAGHEDWLQETIAAPLALYHSDTHPNRKVFYRPYRLDRAPGLPFLRVVVEYNRERTGRISGTVVTAFAVTGPKRREVMVWPR